MNFFSYRERERELQEVERGFAKREEDMARKEKEMNKTAKQLEERSASFFITALFKQSTKVSGTKFTFEHKTTKPGHKIPNRKKQSVVHVEF